MLGNEVFVKFNFNSMSESESLIIDKEGLNSNYGEKYLMCAGKYDKDGWTIVFKANSYQEAEYIIKNNPFKNKDGYRTPETFTKSKSVVC